MYQISEIVLKLQQRNYYIKINHLLILHAILQHCGVAGDKVTDVLHILSGVKLDSQYKTISKSLTSLGLTDQSVSSLLGILEMEGNYGKVASYLRCITKTRGEVSEMSTFKIDFELIVELQMQMILMHNFCVFRQHQKPNKVCMSWKSSSVIWTP